MDPTLDVSTPSPNVIEEDLNSFWQSIYENSNKVQKVTPHFIIQEYLFLFFSNIHRILFFKIKSSYCISFIRRTLIQFEIPSNSWMLARNLGL